MSYGIILELLGIVGIILAIYVAYLSYTIYRENKLSMGMLAMTLGFILIILRRVVSFFQDFSFFSSIHNFLFSIEEILIMLLSILFIVGLVTLKNDLENLGFIDRERVKKRK